MYSTILKGEIENRRYGVMISFVVHTLLLLGVIFAKLSQPIPPPPEQGGILVNLGVPDQEGTGNENAPEGKPAPVEEAEPEPEPVKEPPKPVEEKPSKPAPSKPQPQKEVVTTEDPDAIALKRKKEQEKKQKDAETKAQAEETRKQKDAADAKARQEAEAARKKKELQDQIGGALGGGKGKGKGNSGKTGNPGDPNGGDSDILEGKSVGSGSIGGGLGTRGVMTRPGGFSHDCAETGRVVVYVCADDKGTVTKAEFQLRGSDVSASCNTSKAIAHAKRYKFNKGTGTVCGTITYNFDQK